MQEITDFSNKTIFYEYGYLDEEEVLTEINLSAIKPSIIIKNSIRIDKPSILMVLPDDNVSSVDAIYNFNCLLSMCNGVCITNDIVKIGRRKFNGKLRFVNLKKEFLKIDPSRGKKLRIMNIIPNSNGEKNKPTILTTISVKKEEKIKAGYYWYDLGLYSLGFKTMFEMFSSKQAIIMMFQQLQNLYSNLKSNYHGYNIEFLISCKNNKGYLSTLINTFYKLIPPVELKKYKFFDNICLVNDNFGHTIPLMFNDKKDGLKVIRQNITKINKFLDINSEIEEVDNTSVVDNTSNNIDAYSSVLHPQKTPFVNKLISNFADTKVNAVYDSDVDELKITVDEKQLSKVLKQNKIDDPDIVGAVKSSINNYIKEVDGKPSTSNLELLVLKAINKTLFGTEDIADEYLKNPQLLIEKLGQIKTHKHPLEFPDKQELIKPDDIIDIKYTTGQFRQYYEFHENIHENVRLLFESLSKNPEYPVKIVKIESETKDDNLTRYTDFKVTLKNLNGGYKDPYVVEIKIPAIVNDKYFKIKGTSYIMSTQQFLKPITKTEKNEVRILSNYAIVSLSIQNLKFNPHEISEIINYINIKYPKLISDFKNDNYILFRDGEKINIVGNDIYQSNDGNIVVEVDQNTGKLLINNNPMNIGKFEYIYSIILDKIKKINPDDRLTKTRNSIPYFQMYVTGIRLPLIIYLWSQRGLLSTLNDFGIKYKFTTSQSTQDQKSVYINYKDKYLQIIPETTREELLINGLLVNRIKTIFEDLNDPTAIYDFITSHYGSSSLYKIKLVTENLIDGITSQLLSFENLPSDLPKLLSHRCIDMVMNAETSSLSDLKIYRSRLSEMVLQSAYKQIMMAHNKYRNEVTYGNEDAKIFMDSDWILNDMITSVGVLQNTEPTNPIEEIMLSSKVIKSGRGGVPSKRSFKNSHRIIHPSHYGNLGAVSTSELIWFRLNSIDR